MFGWEIENRKGEEVEGYGEIERSRFCIDEPPIEANNIEKKVVQFLQPKRSIFYVLILKMPGNITLYILARSVK